jgi:hypothetical protein
MRSARGVTPSGAVSVSDRGDPPFARRCTGQAWGLASENMGLWGAGRPYGGVVPQVRIATVVFVYFVYFVVNFLLGLSSKSWRTFGSA